MLKPIQHVYTFLQDVKAAHKQMQFTFDTEQAMLNGKG